MKATSDNKYLVQGQSGAVTLTGLMAYLNVGRSTAERIAAEAGAKIHVGRRVIYNISKVQKYLDEISE
jgi:hypothetical protein